ncbi:hypothetical protein [Gordonia sp. (in: high G+C Gram-positive bacteria)]|uniref:hypothetical protein n=1 Tax=Gordonia sp. (in: high G+C Gram-positive bacteria) TaxID=84139 RepID=UPI003C791828
MARRSIAYHDPTGNTAVKNVMRHRPQQDHADLGLIDDDNTPEMRKEPVLSAKTATDSSLASIQKEV